MYTRRRFLGAIGMPAAAASAATFIPVRPLRWNDAMAVARELSETPGSPALIAQEEAIWSEIAKAFTVDRSLVNLNNGGVSPSPAFVQEAMKRHLDFSNKAPTYTMWRILEPQRETVRQRLAREWGVDTEEIAITRNASESLQICQFGYDLSAGDEVLTSTQDYGRMRTTFMQRERREGIVLKQIQLPVPAQRDRAQPIVPFPVTSAKNHCITSSFAQERRVPSSSVAVPRNRPAIRAPLASKIAARTMAPVNVSAFEPTAGPTLLATSLAPMLSAI